MIRLILLSALTLTLAACTSPDPQPAPSGSGTSSSSSTQPRVITGDDNQGVVTSSSSNNAGKPKELPKGENETDQSGDSEKERELAKTMLEEPDKAQSQVEKLWSEGSGYSEDLATLRNAQALAGTQILGEVIAMQPRGVSVEGRSFEDYELRGYLVFVKRITGKRTIQRADGSEYRIKAGDRVWFYARLIRKVELSPEELVAKGDLIWAAFDQPPVAATTFSDDRGLATAWTRDVSLQKNFATQLSYTMLD